MVEYFVSMAQVGPTGREARMTQSFLVDHSEV